MPNCAILTCGNNSNKCNINTGGISYHRFPKEPHVRSEWIKATGRQDWIPTKFSKICSIHFREIDYDIKKSGIRYLYPGTIPKQNITHVYTVLSSNNTFINTEEYVPSTSQQLNKKCQKMLLNTAVVTTALDATCSTPRKNDSTTGPDIIYSQDNVTTASSPLTPRKRKFINILNIKQSIIKKQKLKINRIQAKNRRLREKVKTTEEVLKSIQDKFFMKDEDILTLKNMNVQVRELLGRMIKSKSGTSKRKYSPALRSFALTLHYYSPKAYEYVRKTFNTCLPARRTIRKWYESIGGDPGFTTESLKALQLKSRNTNYPIIAGLALDEMAIRRRIEWDGEKMHGYVDIGNSVDGDFVSEAKEALVFLVTAVNCNFKVPIGYFLVDGMTGTQRANLVLHSLQLIAETGISIISLTFDGCAANMAMVKSLNCSIEDRKIIFEHPSLKEPILVILDPSHMIKLLRNSFQSYGVIIDPEGNKIKWEYLEMLNDLQQKEKFHLCNKLRYQHINYNNTKMKVKLATQLFSISVAEALDFCSNELNLPEFSGCAATSKFISVINNMFDIFNSRNIYHYNFKKALTENNAVYLLTYLANSVRYLSELKCQNGINVIKSSKKTGFIGFIGCAEAVKVIYNRLISTQILTFMPMYKISQDHLEMLFGNIRSHGGCNNNPTARQFKAAYKKLLVHIEIKSLVNGNCTALEEIAILNCASTPVDRINQTENRYTLDVNYETVTEEEDKEEIRVFFSNISIFSQQIITYIAGFIAHSLMKKINCEICIGALLSTEVSADHKFIVAINKGNLLYPSKDLIKICKISEAVLKIHSENLRIINKKKLITKILGNFVGTPLFNDINYHQIGEYPTSNHVTDLMKAIIEKYMTVRLHFILKTSNLTDSKRQLYNKYILFQGT